MPFPEEPLNVTVKLAIGADLNADPSAWAWTDVTPKVREKRKIQITRGRRGRVGQVAPTKVAVVVDNRDGALSRHNPLSPHFGALKKNTPMKVEVDNGSGPVTRAAVFVPGFPPSWDPSEADQVVTLNGVGLLDRLGRGRVLRSSMRQYLARLSGIVPVAAWTLEDGPLASVGAPMYGTSALVPFTGLHPSGAVVTYPQWGRGTLASWLPPVVSRTGSGGLSILKASVSMPGFAGEWALDFVYASGTDAAISAFDVNPSYLGGTTGWPQLTLDPSAGTVSVSFDGSPETTTDVGGALFDGLAHHVRWHAVQNGADVDWTVYIDGVSHQADTETTSTLTAVSRIGLTSEAQNGAAAALGYVGVWTTPAAVADAAQAALGYRGEMAHDRVQRLCDEEGIRVTVTATRSAAMGPQEHDTLLANLRSCATADLGILSESMDFGLKYLASSERYNLAPTITLAYNQSQILPPWEPADDDQDYFNAVTATRPGGSPVRVADEDDISAVGLYDTSANPNVESDSLAEQVASWLKTLGLNDELTWPAVQPNLSRGGTLLDDWLATDIGDQMHITGHPLPLPSAPIRQVVEGYTEVIGSFEYRPTVILSPAEPYTIAVYGSDAAERRYDSRYSTLSTSYDENDTALVVDIASGPLWITTATHAARFPFDITIAGLVYSCTGISGVASPQTFTVVRLPVDKALASGEPVHVYQPGRYGL